MVSAEGQWVLMAAWAAAPAAALGGFLGMGGSALLAPALTAMLMWAFPLAVGEAFVYALFAAHACALAAAAGGVLAHGPIGRGGARSSFPFWPSLFLGSGFGFLGLLSAHDVLRSWAVAAYFLVAGVVVMWRGVGSRPLPEAPLADGRGAWAMRGALGLGAGAFCGLIGASCSALGLPWVMASESDCRKCASKTMALGMPVAIAGIFMGLAAPLFGLGPTAPIEGAAGWVHLPLVALVAPIGFAMGFLGAKGSRLLPQRALRPLVAVFMVMVGLDLAESKVLDGMGYLGPGEIIGAALAPRGPGRLERVRLADAAQAAELAREARRFQAQGNLGSEGGGPPPAAGSKLASGVAAKPARTTEQARAR